MENIYNPGKVKISAPARVFAFVLRIAGVKSMFQSKVRNPNRSRKGFIPKGILNSYKSDVIIVNSKSVVTFEKKQKVTGTHIIFMHGGSWTFEAIRRHWILARDIVEGSSCRISMVDYPLAPEHSYKETLKMVKNAYISLTEKYASDAFILMGDSAGGNIALALVQELVTEKFPHLPIRNILFCPAVDLTFSNPQILHVEPLDHILSRELLLSGAGQYANGEDLNHHLLSPINGDLDRLPETDIFYGTHEILMPDILKFIARAEKAGARINSYEYEGMQHDWVLFPMPERKKAINEVIGILENLN